MTISNIIGGDQGNRSKFDLYPTPPEVTHALMRQLELPYETCVWEPAAGKMDMALVLSEYVGEVRATDIQQGQDFLTYDPDWRPRADWIITNPPFSMAEQFIRRAYNFQLPFAMLLKSHYWHAKGRIPLFRECQPHLIMPLTWRPSFVKGKNNPMMEMCWNVWFMGKPDATIYLPIGKEPKDGT